VGPHGPRLTPRRSFELFAESVRQRALPWRPVEIEAAGRLRLLLLELVVDRAERMADLNADLSRSNEELDAFAYVAAHDLKEPLRGIHKYAYQLLDDANITHEEHRRKLEALMRLTLRMDGLLDSLLHFSQVGRGALEFEEIDLNVVLAEAIEMVDARRADGQTEIVAPRPLPRTRCDRVRCREIFVNLLSNALKYNEAPRKRVEVGFADPTDAHPRPGCPNGSAGHTIFFVKDNGIGILPRHHGQVFKMFKRLHARDAYGGGTGAGLTIVKKLVERHRGQVWLDPAPNEGTVVYFTLPCDGGARA
jgi:two-component system, chemotaxis family, sensor kinase Cph1